MKYVVVNNNREKAKYYFYIHEVGCKNIPLEAKRFFGHIWEIAGDNVEEAIQKQLALFHRDNQGFSRQEFLVSHCLKHKSYEQICA
jgi:hypothetical protein